MKSKKKKKEIFNKNNICECISHASSSQCKQLFISNASNVQEISPKNSKSHNRMTKYCNQMSYLASYKEYIKGNHKELRENQHRIEILK